MFLIYYIKLATEPHLPVSYDLSCLTCRCAATSKIHIFQSPRANAPMFQLRLGMLLREYAKFLSSFKERLLRRLGT